MSEIDIPRVKALLCAGTSIADIAAELEVSPRTLLRGFTAAAGMSPRAWRMAEVGSQAQEPAPVVSFRFPEHYDLLVDAAEDAGLTPGEYARDAVLARLKRRRRES